MASSNLVTCKKACAVGVCQHLPIAQRKGTKREREEGGSVEGSGGKREREGVEVARQAGDLGVGDAETPHAIRVPPFAEVPLEGARAPVRKTATDITFILNIQAVQLVQPEGNGLAVPAQRQVEGVRDDGFLVVAVGRADLILPLLLLQIRRDLLVRPRLLLHYIVLRSDSV
jgi:hypothetical protein